MTKDRSSEVPQQVDLIVVDEPERDLNGQKWSVENQAFAFNLNMLFNLNMRSHVA